MKSFTWLLILLPLISQAQFYTIGTAQPMEGGCIMLTPDYPYAEGIAYSTSYLDLNFNFEIEFDIYLGDKNDFGADGITFVIHNDPRQFEAFGTFGECLGYGRWSPEAVYSAHISPSVAVEFDTYQNLNQNDPESDHVAFLMNGLSRHAAYWNANNAYYNLEDGMLHTFMFKWDATNKKIAVYLDDNVVYQGNQDLKNDIFKGHNQVIWGFTASTGRKYNLQYFCLKRLAYMMEGSLDSFDNGE